MTTTRLVGIYSLNHERDSEKVALANTSSTLRHVWKHVLGIADGVQLQCAKAQQKKRVEAQRKLAQRLPTIAHLTEYTKDVS